MNETEILRISIELSILGVLLKIIYNKINSEIAKLDKEIKNNSLSINDIRVDIPKSYVSKHSFETVVNRIEVKLDKIYDKLEKKVDRNEN